MTRIRVVTCVAGPDYTILPGEILTVSEATAQQWCRSGSAELVEDPKPAPAKKTAARRTSAKK